MHMGDKLIDKNTRHALAVLNEGCSMCGAWERLPFTVRVASIEAQSQGWRVEGVGELQSLHVHCPMCAQMHDGIMNVIPIECSCYDCPRCQKTDALEYRVSKIEVKDRQFTFEAAITCRRCRNRGKVRSLISTVLGRLKIQLSPTGITVSKE